MMIKETMNWDEFILRASKYFSVMATFEFLMFLVGIQELGSGFKPFSKQEKTDLIALAQCKLLSMSNMMVYTGQDPEGWPLYQKGADYKKLSKSETDYLLRKMLITYFQNEISI